jgi:hypothetical protein
VGDWYRPVAERVDFALKPAKENEYEFVFVHVTDTHVSQNAGSVVGLSRFVREVNAFTPQPRFVVNSGDLLNMSVDLSGKSRDRGRHSFELNSVDESFDAIILDPPTFSRNAKGRRWRVVDDFEHLLMKALEVVAPKCAILLSTNCTMLNPAELRRRARLCAKDRRQTADYLEVGSPTDFPPGHGASTLWMTTR